MKVVEAGVELGAGVLRVGGEEVPLAPGRVVALDAGVVHAVRGAPSVGLLVTMFRAGKNVGEGG